MEMGNYFDQQIEGRSKERPSYLLKPEDVTAIDRIAEKYRKLAHVSPEDKFQIPIKYAIPNSALADGQGPFVIIGFIDRIAVAIDTIVDHKMSVKAWTLAKLLENQRQCQGYVRATGNNKFRFDVGVLQGERIQQFPGQGASRHVFSQWLSNEGLEGFDEWLRSILRAMVESQQSGQWKKKPGDACRFCWYWKLNLCEGVK